MTSIDQNRPPLGKTAARSRRKDAGKAARVQLALGWAGLALVAWALLRNGGAAPLIWHLMCLATLLLFAVQVVLDFQTGLPRPARAALWPALPFFGVLAWILVQGMAGLPPGLLLGLAHPVWAIAPEGAQPAISAHPDAGGPVILRFTCYAMLFWVLLRSAAGAPHGAIAYVQAVALFSTALALYGLVSQVTGYNILLQSDETSEALRASFWNRNTYATVAVFGVLANITAYAKAVSDGAGREGLVALRGFLEAFFSRAWIFAFGALVGLAALALTQSRGGATAGVAGVIVLVWALHRANARASLVALSVPIVLFGFVALFMTSGVVDRFENVASGARPEVFGQIVVGILDRPLVGHGAGAFPDAFRPYKPLSQAAWDWDKAHDSYLENAFEFGLPAAALFYLSLVLIGWRLLVGVRTRKRHQETPAFALACFVAAAVHALVDFSLQIPAVAALFAAILGIGWAQSFATRRAGVPGVSRRSGPDTARPVSRLSARRR